MKRGKQIINGVEYVYEDHPYWDPIKKCGTHKRHYIGKNVDGEFIPNKKYRLQMELDAVKASVKPGPIPALECRRTFYGATYLLDALGEKLGITSDLKSCFPDDYREILSLAYFLVLEEDYPLYRFRKWASTHKHPCGRNIPSQRSSELLGRITENAKMDFFARQSARRSEKEYLAFDTTTISSYSQLIKQAKYGKNKEQDSLAQLNLALLYGEESRLPVYYRKLAGNITDVKTVQNLLKDIDFLQIAKVSLVMDRGFFSEANINGLFRNHHKFLIGVKRSLKFIRKKLDEIRGDFVTRANYDSKSGLYIMSFTMDWEYTETKLRKEECVSSKRRIYVHFYYNDPQAADDKIRFNHFLDTLEEELLSGHRNPEHEKQYTKYYAITETPVRGIKLTPKEDAIQAVEKDYGYFVLMTNGIKDPGKALEIYRSKDTIEKAFGNLKEHLSMRRMAVASEENFEGKLFIQFVALIYLSYIKKVMDEQGLFKNYTMQELLDELDIIEWYQQPGKVHHLGEMTEKQKALYLYMGVDIPS